MIGTRDRRARGAPGRLLAWTVVGLLGLTACQTRASAAPTDTAVYQGRQVVVVEPVAPSLRDPAGDLQAQRLEAFVAAKAERLRSRSLAQRAMETSTWRAAGGGAGADAVTRFEAARRILHEPGTQRIEILFRDGRPAVAVAGARALAEACEAVFREEQKGGDDVQSRIDELGEKIRRVTEEILDATKDFGGVEGLRVRHEAALQQLQDAEHELEALRRRIRELGGEGAATAQEIAIGSPEMARLLLDLEMLRAEERALLTKVAEEHEHVVELRMRIRFTEARLELLTAAWNASPDRKRDLEELGRVEQTLMEQVRRMADALRDLHEVHTRVVWRSAAREQLVRQLEALELQQVAAGVRIRVVGPQVARDVDRSR